MSTQKKVSLITLAIILLTGIALIIMHRTTGQSYDKALVNLYYAAGMIWNAFLFLPQAKLLYRSQNTQNVSALMFIGFHVMQVVAIFNGYFYHDPVLMYGYMAAFATGLLVSSQIIVYRYYRARPAKTLAWVIFALLLIASAIFYIANFTNAKLVVDSIYGISLIWDATVYIPQIVRLYRRKSPEGVSLLMFAGFSVSLGLAILNGFYYHDAVQAYGFIPSFTTCSIVTFLLVRYRWLKRRQEAFTFSAESASMG